MMREYVMPVALASGCSPQSTRNKKSKNKIRSTEMNLSA